MVSREEPFMEGKFRFVNTGTDTLYLLNIISDCDCVQTAMSDSVFAPRQSGYVTMSVNLEGYIPSDITKRAVVISNAKNKEEEIALQCKLVY